MKDVTDIFIVVEGLLEINKEEIRTEPEFKAILTRDRGKKVAGDNDGRKKLFAFKEFMFIKLYYNPLSIYRDLADKKRYAKAVNGAKLPEDWAEDEVVKKAGIRYVEMLNMSALFHTYINANRGVYALGEDLKFFNELREAHRVKIENATKQLLATELEEEIQRLNGIITNSTKSLLDLGASILKINTSLPTAFDTVEELKIKLLKESGEGKSIHGGGKLGNRE